MNKNNSASRLFNQFTKEVGNKPIFGFVSNGATILTTKQELARDLRESTKVFAYENGYSTPIDLLELGIDFSNASLAQNAKNVIFIKSCECHGEYFDKINKKFNPAIYYQTAVIISNKNGADLLTNTLPDTLVLRHIQENNVDISEPNKYVPGLSMVMSQEDNPGIQLHFDRSHQFNDASDRIKWLIGLTNKKLQSSTDTLSTSSEKDVLSK